jgi:seipin
LWKVWGLPGHVLGWRDLDVERMRVRMWEGAVFKRGVGGVPRRVRVEVAVGGAVSGLRELAASHQAQVYSASVTFNARFSGLRYLVYNHRIVSFVVFTTVFYVVSIITMGLVWAWIGPSIMVPESKAVVKQEPASQADYSKGQKPAIKTEDEDEESMQGLKLEDVSDTPAQYPSGRGRTPLRYEGRQSGEGGSAAATQEREIGEGEKADDEEEEEDDDTAEYDRAFASATGRFEGDSGIGTMSEGARAGDGSGHGHDLVRRRSGRGGGVRQ